MNRLLPSIVVVMLLTLPDATIDAQIILKPQVMGTRGICIYHCYPSHWWDFSFGGICGGLYFSGTLNCHYDLAACEFGLDATEHGGIFPPPGMTEHNWKAWLSGLELGYFARQPDSLVVYDMLDASEDGIFSESEYAGNYVATFSPHYFFAPLDITDILRQDLFHSSPEAITCGFIFGNPPSPYFPLDLTCLRGDQIRISILGDFPAPPTATPVTTPTPTLHPGVELVLSGQIFKAGDDFKLQALCTSLPNTYTVDLYIVLDAFGEYFFYPEWKQTPGYRSLTLPPGKTVPVFILDFEWPEGVFGTVSGLAFRAAILEAQSATIIGSIDHVFFGYQ